MKFFIVRLRSPTCQIREQELAVKVCKQTVWAIRPDGRRHLIGSSAFQTLAGAQRCQRALLQKIVDDTYHKIKRPSEWSNAQRVLQTLH